MMKTGKFLPYVLLVGLLLALAGSVGRGLAQGPEPPEGEVQPQGEVSIAATMGSKFSYQGVLKESGSPVTGSRDMTFRLYSDGTCSTQVGSDIVKSGVQVTDGLFSVELDVTHSDFNGQGLWLEVEVGGTAVGCREILPVPYALSLRPGAQVIGEQTNGNAIYAYNTATTGGTTYGVYGRTDSGSTGASGVYGYAPTGSTFGVHGRADGSNSFASGVFGEATATSAPTYGVRGQSASTAGYGVYGAATAASGTTYGVYGRSDSPSGAAIYGQGDVKQNRTGNGLVKAAVYVNCNDNSLIGGCSRAFNNASSSTVSCSIGPSEGKCILDFGFDISDRFWVAMADGGGDDGVSCVLGGSNDQLDCSRWDASSGAEDGYIMVLVY
jgi:hypothetical protein